VANETVFGVDLTKATAEIDAKYKGGGQPPGGAGGEGESHADAGDSDLAPETELENAPEAEEATEEGEGNQPLPKAPEEGEGTEFGITKDGKIRLYGKTYSPVELSLALEKLEGIEKSEAENQKFEEHFEADIEELRRNPSLIHVMAQRGYPEAFVHRAAKILRSEGIMIPRQSAPAAKPASNGSEGSPESTTTPPNSRPIRMEDLPKELVERINKALAISDKAQVQGWSDEITKTYEAYDSKHKIDPEMAVKVQRLADAELKALSSKGHKIVDDEGKVRTELVRRVYESAHRSLKAQLDKRVRSVVTGQKKANSSVRDNGNGGVVPTRPKEKAKTVRQAANEWIADIDAQR
jgi:hypothetical protein